MEGSTILAIVGIAITIAFGVWGAYLVKRRYPGRIAFVNDSTIGLFDFIERNWDELAVYYKNQPVSHNLVLLRGIWHNTGSIDLTPAMIEEKLAIKLPTGYKWIDAKVIRTASKVIAKVIVSPDCLEFDIGLFRCGEHIRFEALAEVPSVQRDSSKEKVGNAGARLCKAMNIDYRIANTRKVIIEDAFSLGVASKNRMRKSAVASALVLAFFFAVSFMWLPAKNQSATYLMRDDSGKAQEVRLNFAAPGPNVYVTYVSTGETRPVSLSEVKRRGYDPAPPPGVLSSIILPFILIVILAPGAIFLTSFYIDKKRRRKLSGFLASCEPYRPESPGANVVEVIEGNN